MEITLSDVYEAITTLNATCTAICIYVWSILAIKLIGHVRHRKEN